jgi:hypothetical protein
MTTLVVDKFQKNIAVIYFFYIGIDERPTEKKKPCRPEALHGCGFKRLRGLFHKQCERMHIGLQRDENADQRSKSDRMEEHVTQDFTLVSVPFGRR